MAKSRQETASKDETGYEPIELKVCDAVGKTYWSPAWEVHFHYSHFDEVLPDGSGLFVDRQVDPGSRLPEVPLVTRESAGIDENPTGCHVSLASLPPRREEPYGGELYDPSDSRTAHQRDWDALVEWRENLFAKHGISEDTSLLEKVRLLAEHVRNRSGPVYASRHPVDVLLHSSYCVGKANALAALLHTMGVPARTINLLDHSIVEVCLDGRWYLTDNVPGAALMEASAMEVFATPGALKGLSEQQMKYYGGRELHSNSPYNLSGWWHWHFNQCGRGLELSKETLLNGAGIGLCLDPSTAKALYPNAERYLFKVLKGGPPVLITCRKHSWYRAGLRLLEGQWIRKKFYVGRLHDPKNPVRKVVAVLHLMGGEAQTMDTGKADWFLKINGTSHNLREVEGWSIRKEFDGLMMPRLTLEFVLPLRELKEEDYNTLELGTDEAKPKGQSQFLHVMIYPDPILPYTRPFLPSDQPRQTYWDIRSDHEPELRQVVGFER